MYRAIILILMGSLAAGCTDADYRHWADSQVNDIVRNREEQTLAYAPQVEANSQGPTKPGASAYARVPESPKPPPTTSPVEPSDVVLPFGKLGPEKLFPQGVTAPVSHEYGIDSATLEESQRVSLGPPAPTKPVIRLDLFGSLKYSVLHSRDYKSQMEDLYLAALNVTLQRHMFDPIPSASVGLQYAGGQENVDYAAALTAVNSIGIKQELPYGGTLAAAATVDFVRALSGNAANAEPATVTLSASIPLLRGAGLVNLEPLIQSERTMVYQVRTFEDYRRNFVVNVATQYFQLLAADQAIADRAANLLSLEGLTARSQALFAAGRLGAIDVQRSLQDQLQAEQDLINARSTYEADLDNYKLLIGMSVDQPLEVIAQELTVKVPKYEERQAADLAKRYRLDLRTAEDQVEDAQRGVEVAKNHLLPDLNVAAQGTFGNNPGDAASNLNNDQSAYSASVTLNLPLDRLAERNQYRSSLITLERARRNAQQLNDQVSADARQSLRLIESATVSLQIQRKNIDLAKQRLDNSNDLLRTGKGDNRDVVDAQAALLASQDSYAQAQANLQIQVLGFLRDTGTLRLDPSSGAIADAMNRKTTSVNEHAPLR